MGIKKLKLSKLRTPFLPMALLLLIVVITGLFTIHRVDIQLGSFNQALLVLEKISAQTTESLYLVQKYHFAIKDNDKENSKFYKMQIRDLKKELGDNIEVLGDIKSNSWPGLESIQSIYYHNSWRLDEHLLHFVKLVDKLVISKNYDSSRDIMAKVSAQGARTQKALAPVRKLLIIGKDGVNNVNTVLFYIANIILLILIIIVYFTIYLPWSAHIKHIEKERERLEEVLSESELRGSTFFWELSYDTKVTKRSNHLSGLFELDSKEDETYLYDELSLFSEEDTVRFIELLDRCVEKGDVFDFKVRAMTPNKKVFWLHYYAKFKMVGNKKMVIGTVRDITKRELASRRFDRLFDNLLLPALAFGDGKIRKVNKVGLQFFGIGNQSNIENLHPGILFPLYQHDGNSSLEKLSKSVGHLTEESVFEDDWTFKTNRYSEVTLKTTFFNVPFDESSIHIMIIHDHDKRQLYQQRLVSANRKILHLKRQFVEYRMDMSLVLDDMMNSLKNDSHNRFDEIESNLEQLWENNLNGQIDDIAHMALIYLKGFIRSHQNYWDQVANKFNRVITINHSKIGESFFWVDGQKLSYALRAIIESAISDSSQKNIEINFNIKKLRAFQFIFVAKVKCDNIHWFYPENYSAQSSKSLRKFYHAIDALQGQVQVSEREDKEQYVEISCFIESAHARATFKEQKYEEQDIENFVETKVLNAKELWSQVACDWEMIETVAKDFLDYYPLAVADINYWFEEKELESVKQVTNDLLGVLNYFPFSPSFETIKLINIYSTHLRIGMLAEQIIRLNSELNDLADILKQWLDEKEVVNS